MNPVDNLLTPEVQAYVKTNPNLNLSDLVSTTIKQGIGLIFVFIIIITIYKLFVYIQSDTLGGKNEGKEGLTMALRAFVSVVIVVGTFIYLFPNLFCLSPILQQSCLFVCLFVSFILC